MSDREVTRKPGKHRSLTCAHCGKETIALIDVLESEAAYDLGMAEQHITQLLKDKEDLEALREGLGHSVRLTGSMRELMDDVTIEAGPYLDRTTKFTLAWQEWLEKNQHVIDRLQTKDTDQ